jgi:hypothetical protein
VSGNGSNTLASIDRVSIEVREHTLPDAQTRFRRLVITSGP